MNINFKTFREMFPEKSNVIFEVLHLPLLGEQKSFTIEIMTRLREIGTK